MRRKVFILPLLLLTFMIFAVSVSANEPVWTEKRLGKMIIRADHAAHQKKWGRAIKYGEQMLEGSHALDQESDARYINQLKSLNRYYDRAGRLQEVTTRVSKAYFLSRKYLGIKHSTSKVSRLLYYKTLISQKNYGSAIPLVLESISTLGNDENNKFQKLHYLEQLLSLYGFTGQFKKQEKSLLQFLDLNTESFGSQDKSNTKVIEILAKNYCRQKQLDKFSKLNSKYQLHLNCME